MRSLKALSWRACVLAYLMAVPAAWAANVVTVQPGDVAGLRNAILGANQIADTTIINTSGTFNLTQPLPNVTGSVVIVGTPLGAGGPPATRFVAGGAGFPAATVSGGLLKFAGVEVSGFSVTGNGGAIQATGGRFEASGVVFRNNTASGDGGAIAYSGTASGSVTDSTLENNRATRGGGISTTSSTSVRIETSQLTGNTATVFGCDVNSDGGGGIFISGSQLSGTCANVRIEDPRGPVTFSGNTVVAPSPGAAIDSTASVTLANNAFSGVASPPQQQGAKSLCNDFGSRAFRSLGGNIAADASCFLDQPTDRPNTDPQLAAPDANGVIAPRDGSPALEAGPSALLTLPGGARSLPCGYKDLRGLGRPQDLNNDGIFACDGGVIEKQGGANIGAPQTTAVFDPARAGEGTFIEMLDNNQVWVGTFTYTPTGGLAWFVGQGNVVGNSAVLDEMKVASGGVFGAAYDPSRVVLTRVGGASFVFPTCEAVTRPGQFAFQAAPGSGYEDVLTKALRLTQILPCTGAAPANSGRSGSFYSPSRAYEGIFVEFLSDGRVLLIWYTWDPQGRQFWTISDAVTVTGNRITANMIYAVQTTRFGSNFNSSQIAYAPWGTVTLTYNNCDDVTFAYNSTVAGFGSGTYAYARLTRPRGTACTP